MHSKLLPLTLIILLAGCANTPKFDISQVDKSLTPQSVIAEAELSQGKIALWGGTILATRNQKDNTQIEVLAYPLNSYHRPLQDSKPLGRFIIQHAGYLEPSVYQQGKSLTVLGSISKNQKGKVGESEYTYPVINARQHHLWKPGDSPQTSFHFGLGIRL